MIDLVDRRGGLRHDVQVQLHIRRRKRFPTESFLQKPVAQDRKEPATCRGRIAELVQRLLSYQKGLLRQVFRIRRPTGKPKGKPIHRQMKLLDKLLDRDGWT